MASRIFLIASILFVHLAGFQCEKYPKNVHFLGLFNALLLNNTEDINKYKDLYLEEEFRQHVMYTALFGNDTAEREKSSTDQRVGFTIVKRDPDAERKEEYMKVMGAMAVDLSVVTKDDQMTFLMRELIDERLSHNRTRTEKLAKIEDVGSGVLWFETIRSAIEKFENDFGKYAQIEFAASNEGKDLAERRRAFREKIWNWIFTNQKHRHRVKSLIERINASGKFTSTEEFSTLISEAHDELCRYNEHELLRPGQAILSGKLVSNDPHMNSVIELFMGVFMSRNVTATVNKKL